VLFPILGCLCMLMDCENQTWITVWNGRSVGHLHVTPVPSSRQWLAKITISGVCSKGKKRQVEDFVFRQL
jgi:hypothetical protein